MPPKANLPYNLLWTFLPQSLNFFRCCLALLSKSVFIRLSSPEITFLSFICKSLYPSSRLLQVNSSTPFLVQHNKATPGSPLGKHSSSLEGNREQSIHSPVSVTYCYSLEVKTLPMSFLWPMKSGLHPGFH